MVGGLECTAFDELLNHGGTNGHDTRVGVWGVALTASQNRNRRFGLRFQEGHCKRHDVHHGAHIHEHTLIEDGDRARDQAFFNDDTMAEDHCVENTTEELDHSI